MNIGKVFSYKVSQHVTKWFQKVDVDGESPALLLERLSTLVLAHMDRFRFSLACSETQFRRNICNAVCMMYYSNKMQMGWRGPLSRVQRPTGWSHTLEYQWKDILRMHYFSYDLWQTIWSQIPEALWESTLPHWREAIEGIYLHYIACRQELLDDYIPELVQGRGEDMGHVYEGEVEEM